uniref:Terpene synthase metal-binding domain-containing protein n=1 Tax=Oryza glumipatula TaxID=40148 RepID=A0A0D9Z7A9_9ORYZ
MASASCTAPKTAPEFHPTVWGDFFINYEPQPLQACMLRPEKWMRERSDQLRKDVSQLFDAFDDVFNKFKHRDESFIIDITNDPKGLLSLYNAANLLTHNEEALQEAILFSRHHLELMKSNLKSPLAEQVSRALQIPLSRTLKRVEALSYILEYNVHEQRYNPLILELAKLDFNLLQHIHQRELKTITQWWEDLSNDIGLDYIRDRIVECYFWSYSMYFEEEYTRARMILAKFFMLTSLLDDTYDTHATLEECRKLNVAIQSWDESDISVLPDYLKNFFLKVMSNFVEFENELEPHIRHRNAYIRKVSIWSAVAPPALPRSASLPILSWLLPLATVRRCRARG